MGLASWYCAELVADVGLGPTAGGLDQVELDLGGELAGDELVEQAEDRLAGRIAAHRGQGGDGALALGHRAAVDPLLHQRDRGGGVGIGEHPQGLGPGPRAGQRGGAAGGVGPAGILQFVEGLQRRGAGAVGLVAVGGERDQRRRRPP